MPNIEQNLLALGGIPEVEVTLEVSGMTQTPVDRTLTIEGMAADAKATGSAIADINSDIYDIQGDIDELQAETGADIPLTDGQDADSIAEAVQSAMQRIETLENKTGADIPLTDATGAPMIGNAVGNAIERIGTLENTTNGLYAGNIPYTRTENPNSIKTTVDGINTRLGTAETAIVTINDTLVEMTTAEIDAVFEEVFGDEE